MNKYLVLVSYPDSYEDDDLVEFELPGERIPDHKLTDEIKFCRSQLALDDFKTPQDLADAALTMAASRWNGTWGYKAVAGVVEIDELDDPDPTEYDEDDEEEET